MVKFILGVCFGSWMTLGLMAIWQHFPDWSWLLIAVPIIVGYLAGIALMMADN